MVNIGSLLGVYGSGPSGPWLWIIEYLSSLPEIEFSIIHSILQDAPISPEAVDERTNERVALKCLEVIFGFKQRLQNVAPPNLITFDLSLSCQNVLNQILNEVPLSTLNVAGPELLKWDMWPFIIHKRRTLPKCKLEELKELYNDRNSELQSCLSTDDAESIDQGSQLIASSSTVEENETLMDERSGNAQETGPSGFSDVIEKALHILTVPPLPVRGGI